jgi:hypothetical protein
LLLISKMNRILKHLDKKDQRVILNGWCCRLKRNQFALLQVCAYYLRQSHDLSTF